MIRFFIANLKDLISQKKPHLLITLAFILSVSFAAFIIIRAGLVEAHDPDEEFPEIWDSSRFHSGIPIYGCDDLLQKLQRLPLYQYDSTSYTRESGIDPIFDRIVFNWERPFVSSVQNCEEIFISDDYINSVRQLPGLDWTRDYRGKTLIRAIINVPITYDFTLYCRPYFCSSSGTWGGYWDGEIPDENDRHKHFMYNHYLINIFNDWKGWVDGMFSNLIPFHQKEFWWNRLNYLGNMSYNSHIDYFGWEDCAYYHNNQYRADPLNQKDWQCRTSINNTNFPQNRIEGNTYSWRGDVTLRSWVTFMKPEEVEELPDLVPDLSELTIKIDGVDQQLPVGYNTGRKRMVINNIVVRNEGDADSYPTEGELTAFDGYLRIEFPIPAIPAGESITLDPIDPEELANQLRRLERHGHFNNLALLHNSTYDDWRWDLEFEVDHKNNIVESNEDNNTAKLEDAMTFSAIRVKVIYNDNDDVVPSLNVSLYDVLSDYNRSSNTNEEGLATFAVLREPGNDGIHSVFIVTAEVRGNSISNAIIVNDYALYETEIQFNINGAIFIPIPLIPSEYRGQDFRPLGYLVWTDGYAIVETNSGQEIRRELDREGVYFSQDDLAEVEFLILKELQVRYDNVILFPGNIEVGREDIYISIKYNWPIEGQDPIRVDIVQDGMRRVRVEMKLKTDCTQATRITRICIYDEPDEIIEGKQKYLSPMRQQLMILQAPHRFGLRVTETVWVMPHLRNAFGFFNIAEEGDRSLLFISGRYIKLHPLLAKSTTTHEAIHALDYQWGREISSRRDSLYSVDWAPYNDSINLTIDINNLAGQWAWKYLSHTCALMRDVNSAVARYCTGYSEPAYQIFPTPEMFAEQMTNVCIGLPVRQKLLSAVSEWRRLNPGVSVPTDLLAQRDIIASRSIGARDVRPFGPSRGNVIYDYTNGVPVTAFSERIRWLVNHCIGNNIRLPRFPGFGPNDFDTPFPPDLEMPGPLPPRDLRGPSDSPGAWNWKLDNFKTIASIGQKQ